MEDMLSYFSKELIIDKCSCKTYEDMLKWASDYLCEKGYVKDTFKESILNREIEYPTGLRCIPFSAGIPHTYPEHVNIPGVFVIRMDNPISTKEMGGDEEIVDNIRFIFMLLLEQKSNAHLKMLQGLIAMFQNISCMKELEKAKTVDEIYTVIKKHIKV